MSGDSSIEWTDKTWNPVAGCSKVSEGCRNCYAETISLRFKRSVGPWNAVNAPQNVVLHPERLTAPLGWGKPARVFVNSMSDLFHELVPYDFIDQVFAVMAATPHLTYQVLTKRPERMAEYINGAVVDGHLRAGFLGRLIDVTGGDLNAKGVDPFWMLNIAYKGWPWPLPNVWLGTSVEDQKAADERIPHLIRTPAVVRFLSCEPLLGPVNLEPWLVTYDSRYGEPWGIRDDLHWVIVGGESGPKHRPLDLEWMKSIAWECHESGVPLYVKQDSGLYPGRQGRIPDDLWLHQFPESPVLAEPRP